ncbi:MAG: hypothetical protein JXM70_22205 [Pirellulales bacterium]|nr:hypothetical protein [Pirellulales bacterium]
MSTPYSITSTGHTDKQSATEPRNINDVLRSHCDFWEGKGRLIRTRPYMPVTEARVPLARCGISEKDIYLEPDMLDPRDFLPDRTSNTCLTDGDVFSIRGPYKIPWTEAIMGCPIKLVPQSGASWAESCLTDLSDIEHLRLKHDNPWLQKLVDFTQVISQRHTEDYCATHTTMRGPIDMADALLGTERLCIAMLDQPRRVQALLEICTEAFIEIARSQWKEIPPIHGGYVCRYGIWAPGHVTRTQADAASMLSPELYRRNVLPFDLEVLRAFPYSIMHVHSAYPYIAEPFLNEQDVPSAIQVGYDQPPFGPGIEQLLPTLRQMLQRKPLVFHGVVTRQEFDLVHRELPDKGILLDLFLTD